MMLSNALTERRFVSTSSREGIFPPLLFHRLATIASMMTIALV